MWAFPLELVEGDLIDIASDREVLKAHLAIASNISPREDQHPSRTTLGLARERS